MTPVRIVVDEIKLGEKDAEGDRTLKISGRTFKKALGHCDLTFATAKDLARLRAALDAN